MVRDIPLLDSYWSADWDGADGRYQPYDAGGDVVALYEVLRVVGEGELATPGGRHLVHGHRLHRCHRHAIGGELYL